MRRECFLALCLLAFLTPIPATVLAQSPGIENFAAVYRGKYHSNSSLESIPSICCSYSDRSNSSDELSDIEALEQQCLEEINRLRAAYHLAPLAPSKDLLTVARSHSRRMAEDDFFSHTDPEGRTARERVNEAGIKWKALAENIASSRGYVNPVAVSLHGWMNSSGHRSNILNGSFNQTAVGVWISERGTVYFTELFLRR